MFRFVAEKYTLIIGFCLGADNLRGSPGVSPLPFPIAASQIAI